MAFLNIALSKKQSIPTKKCDVHRAVDIYIRNGMIATEKVAKENRVTKVYEYLDSEYFTWLFESNRIPPPEKLSPLDDSSHKFTIINPRQWRHLKHSGQLGGQSQRCGGT